MGDLGNRLRTLREAAGLTQGELAFEAALSRRTIARIEAGLHTPNRSTLRLIAQALDVAISTLVPNGDEGEAA